MSHKISLINPSLDDSTINPSSLISSSTPSSLPLLPTYPSVLPNYNSSFPSDILLEIRSIKSNNYCSDCSRSNPEWASVSLGVLLCLSCAGKHRGLGVRLSFVRSLIMDSWTAHQIEAIRQGGNEQFLTFIHSIYSNIKSINKLNNKQYLEFFSSSCIDDYRLKLKTRTESVYNFHTNKLLPYELVPWVRGGKKLFSSQEIEELIHSTSNLDFHLTNSNSTSYGDDNNELIKSMSMITSHSTSSSPLSLSDSLLTLPNNINSKLSETYNILFPIGTMGMILTKGHGGLSTVVSKIIEGSVASQYGVQVGDIITRIDSQALKSLCLGDFESVMKIIQFAPRPLHIEFRRNPQNYLSTTPTVNNSLSNSINSSKRNSDNESEDSNEDSSASSTPNKSKIVNNNNKGLSALSLPQFEISETSRESDDSDNKLSFSKVGVASRKLSPLNVTPPIRSSLNSPKNSVSNLTTQLKNSSSTDTLSHSSSNNSLSHSNSNNSLTHSISNNSLSQSTSSNFLSQSIDSVTDEIELSFKKNIKNIEYHTQKLSITSLKQIDTSNSMLEDNYNNLIDIFSNDLIIEENDFNNFSYTSPLKMKPPLFPYSNLMDLNSSFLIPSTDQIAIPSPINPNNNLEDNNKFNMDPGTPIKVLRLSDMKWKSASIIRMHRNQTFKIIYRNGENESYVTTDRIAFSLKMLDERGIKKNRNKHEKLHQMSTNSPSLSVVDEYYNSKSPFSPQSSPLPSFSSLCSSPSVLYSTLFDNDLLSDLQSCCSLSSSLASSISEKELIGYIDETLDDSFSSDPLTLSSLIQYKCFCESFPFFCMPCSQSSIISFTFTHGPLGLTLHEGDSRESIVLNIIEYGQAEKIGIKKNDILIQISNEIKNNFTSFLDNKVCVSYNVAMEKLSSLSFPLTLSFLRLPSSNSS